MTYELSKICEICGKEFAKVTECTLKSCHKLADKDKQLHEIANGGKKV